MTRLRCAIYTRKSSEEGLDQDFNSLEAQREACAAYILSQRHEGWRELPERYDDGGYSGGSMNRPGLQRLLDEVRAGRVDVVVVYKVDRLTRALSDFAKMVEVFDAAGVYFVSVTQAFNTTSSMGRLTLNVLLSFAQFEREVTAERIRDKIAASKRKGMWMGGLPPLGYDVEDRALVVNPAEAETVRRIFRSYIDCGTVPALKAKLNAAGIVSKRRENGNGGKPFSRGALYALLRNPVYIGEVRHKGERHAGRHPAIIDRELWDEVQRRLDGSGGGVRNGRRREARRLLDGKLHDGEGRPMRSTWSARTKTARAASLSRRYWYYVSHTSPNIDTRPARLPADALERFVIDEVVAKLRDAGWLSENLHGGGASHADLATATDRGRDLADAIALDSRALPRAIRRIDLYADTVSIALSGGPLLDQGRTVDASALTFQSPLRLRQSGRARPIMIGARTVEAKRDPDLIAMVADARRWMRELQTGAAASVGEIERRESRAKGSVSRILPLAFLAPDIAAAILDGRQPESLTAGALRRLPELPMDWDAQRQALGFEQTAG